MSTLKIMSKPCFFKKLLWKVAKGNILAQIEFKDGNSKKGGKFKIVNTKLAFFLFSIRGDLLLPLRHKITEDAMRKA